MFLLRLMIWLCRDSNEVISCIAWKRDILVYVALEILVTSDEVCHVSAKFRKLRLMWQLKEVFDIVIKLV